VPILLEPMIVSFCQANPEAEVEIAASGELVDIAAQGFDAGIRLGQFIEGDMIAVRLSRPFPLLVVGSPDYLKERGRPRAIADLRPHSCLRLRRSDGSIASWSFRDGNRTVEAAVSGPLIASDLPTLVGAAVEGLGLVQVPEPVARARIEAGNLQAVLRPFSPEAPGVFLYYSGHRQILPKLRAFIDHVKKQV
jgi:DNA-binding transcriptional LysR family regulator